MSLVKVPLCVPGSKCSDARRAWYAATSGPVEPSDTSPDGTAGRSTGAGWVKTGIVVVVVGGIVVDVVVEEVVSDLSALG
ncbi:MAG: hypothetical protein F2723_02680 [Actinobacteria bacterium]|nr:hypothetical protein [Actinomycetota bacterium]